MKLHRNRDDSAADRYFSLLLTHVCRSLVLGCRMMGDISKDHTGSYACEDPSRSKASVGDTSDATTLIISVISSDLAKRVRSFEYAYLFFFDYGRSC